MPGEYGLLGRACIALAWLFGFAPAPARADDDCLAAPAEARERADVLLEGRVRSVEDAEGHRRATMEVVQVWKGEYDHERVVVRTPLGASSVRFAPGTSWLVYAQQGPDGLVTDRCARTRRIETAESERAELGAGVVPVEVASIPDLVPEAMEKRPTARGGFASCQFAPGRVDGPFEAPVGPFAVLLLGLCARRRTSFALFLLGCGGALPPAPSPSVKQEDVAIVGASGAGALAALEARVRGSAAWRVAASSVGEGAVSASWVGEARFSRAGFRLRFRGLYQGLPVEPWLDGRAGLVRGGPREDVALVDRPAAGAGDALRRSLLLFGFFPTLAQLSAGRIPSALDAAPSTGRPSLGPGPTRRLAVRGRAGLSSFPLLFSVRQDEATVGEAQLWLEADSLRPLTRQVLLRTPAGPTRVVERYALWSVTPAVPGG